MKKVIIAMLCLGNTAYALTSNLSIRDAIQRQLVAATFYPKGGTMGYCMKATYTNLTEDTLHITTEPGTRLDCIDNHITDLLITSSDILVLDAKQSTDLNLLCLSTTNDLFAPTYTSFYELITSKNDEVDGLCQLIDSLSLNCYTGQSAVWTLFMRKKMGDIIGAKIHKVNALRKYISDATGIEFEDFANDYYVMTNPIYRSAKANRPIPLGINGTYYVNNYLPSDKITLELYNSTGDKIN